MTKSTKDKHAGKSPPAQPATGDAGDVGALNEVESLRARVAELEEQLAQANDARQRALADFMNYQKRAMVNEREARQEGAGRVVESLLAIADYLDMALKQDPASVSAKSVFDGVWLIRDELHKVFQEHDVTPIRPEPGDEPDPARHHAMGHQAVHGVRPGAIAHVQQPGYEMAGKVLRPAKVFLTPPDVNAEEAADADV